jgi:hypothetical protein
MLVNDLNTHASTILPTLSVIRPVYGRKLYMEMQNYLIAKFIYPDTANKIMIETVWKNHPEALVYGIWTYFEKAPVVESIFDILDVAVEL